MPKGGFGNLIALPLQKQPRKSGRSVFVNDHLQPYPDQWAFLASISPMSRRELEDAILRASGGRHPLDVAFTAEEEDRKPWQRPSPVPTRITGPLPESLTLVLDMPISWKRTLQQYAGRLHREHAGKQDVRIYDYAETDQPQLKRMWNKRQRGYRAMGYEIKPMETVISGAGMNLK